MNLFAKRKQRHRHRGQIYRRVTLTWPSVPVEVALPPRDVLVPACVGWSRADGRSSQSKEPLRSLCPRAGTLRKEGPRGSHLLSTQEHQGWFLTAPVRSQLPTSPLLLLPSSLPLAGSETSLSRNDPGRKRALPSPQFW